MARKKIIKTFAFNITAHPHELGTYVRLWKALYEQQKPIEIGRDQALIVGSIEQTNHEDELDGYSGVLRRFTLIDSSRPWFDLVRGEEADKGVVAREVRIPAHLAPNLTSFLYRFFPRSHKLVVEAVNVEGQTLGPASVEKALRGLIAHPSLVAEFKTVQVVMEKSREKVDEIITNHRLKRLIITVERPNPDDDSDDDERAVLGQMIEENLRSKRMDLKAIGSEAIRPTAETMRFARVSASNGELQAVDRDTGRKISSREHPKIGKFSYSAKAQERTAAFLNAASRFLSDLLPAKGKSSGSDPAPPVV